MGPMEPLQRKKREVSRKRGGVLVFLLAGAVPVAGLVWFFLQPEAARTALLDRIPAGWGGRAAHAGIAFGVLVLLARVALPAFHGASGFLTAAQRGFAARKGGMRALLFPVEALVGLLRVIVQALYAIDVALILAACLVLLLLAVRVMKPDILPSILPGLGR